VKILIMAQVSHLCPYKDEIDIGRICLELAEPTELYALAEYLRSFTDQVITHEAMTQEIAKHTNARVVTYWTTAGLSIEVEA
jgi:NADPH-dependent 7-cyano-7-deazaguanine reductase QueF